MAALQYWEYRYKGLNCSKLSCIVPLLLGSESNLVNGWYKSDYILHCIRLTVDSHQKEYFQILLRKKCNGLYYISVKWVVLANKTLLGMDSRFKI